MRKANYVFDSDELAPVEKVLSNLENRLFRDKKRYPDASLWINIPNLFTDISEMQITLRSQVSSITIDENIVKMIRRTIEHLVVIHPEKWLKILYGVTEQKMKRLYLKISNGFR